MNNIMYIMAGFAALTALPMQSAEARSLQGSGQETCREYTRDILIDGKREQGVGTACLQKDGSWKIISDATVQADAPESQANVEPKTVIVHRDHYYPDAYHRGHRGSWGPRSGVHISLGKQFGGRHLRHRDRYYDRYHHRHYGRYDRRYRHESRRGHRHDNRKRKYSGNRLYWRG